MYLLLFCWMIGWLRGIAGSCAVVQTRSVHHVKEIEEQQRIKKKELKNKKAVSARAGHQMTKQMFASST